MDVGFLRCIWKNRELVWRLTEREVLGRYRGSLLGIGWSFLNPMAMLAVYTFVFSKIFNVRWGTLEASSPTVFAINLFAGLIVFNLFSEAALRSPGLVLANPNYVTKVIFPLEVLSVVAVAGALFHAGISLIALFLVEIFALHGLPWTTVWLPLVWLPLLLFSLATSWLLSALGVFIRDIGQIVALLVNMLMFLSPVFYPATALPATFRTLLMFNPLAQVIEQTRQILLVGVSPSLNYLLSGSVVSFAFCAVSFHFFSRAKKVFADVM
jgi:lipopolysaccharide transport system permease protein